MSQLNLDIRSKQNIDKFIQQTKTVNPQQLDQFKDNFAHGNKAAWQRFLVGAYNHPLTWWIGIIQLQMQMGLWGFKYKSVAAIRANKLRQITAPLRKEIKGGLNGEPMPIITNIIKYNIKHRKADILGRFTGGAFTNYASTGGRMGNKALPTSAKAVRTVTNLGLASYGAAIQAVVKGHNNLEAVIQSILTGRPEQLPANIKTMNDIPLTKEEERYQEAIESALLEISKLTQLSPGPIPIKEFCQKKENMNLKGICK